MGCRCFKGPQPAKVLAEEEEGPEIRCMKGPLPAEASAEEEQSPEVQNFLDAAKVSNGAAVFSLFRDASPAVKKHRDCALAAVKSRGGALYYAADHLKDDKEVVLAAVAQDGEALVYAANHLKADKKVVLAAVGQSGRALDYASDSFKQDPEVVMVASVSHGDAQKYLYQSANYWSNKDMVLSVVKRRGEALKFTDHLRADKDVALAAVTQSGEALEFAADNLRADKEVVLAAVTQNGPSLKYAKPPLNQDPDCLKASGLWDLVPVEPSRTEQAILSVKFSLAEKSTKYATDFALAMKEDPFLRNFKTYNPNAFEKDACDPKFTSMDHPCKGTLETCARPDGTKLPNLTEDVKPCKDSCWRFAFRFHLEECKVSNGFLIQVEEKRGLGDGQKIETEMARMVGLKVFRTYTNDVVVKDASYKYGYNGIDAISKAVQEWYATGCLIKDMENVFIGDERAATRLGGDYSYDKRPKHEKL